MRRKVMLKAVLLVLVSFGALAQNIGFERGNTITTDEIDGYLTVNCHDGRSRWVTYSCYDIALNGGAYGKLVVTNGTIDADWVQLQREGDNIIKGAAFNANTQATGFNFNLWIRTLFQRPLLKKGSNVIHYTFLKNQVEVAQGQFQVDVLEGDYRSCRRSTTTYYGSCPIASSACMDYFRRLNYCK